MAIQNFYYYEEDAKITNQYVAVPPSSSTQNNFSLLNLGTYPLYDEFFIQMGVLTRFVTDVYIEAINKYYQVYYYTIFFNNTNDSISFNFTFITDPNNTGNFPPGFKINSVITSCSGSIYNKTGTVVLEPLDNPPKTRILTVTLN